MTWADEQTPKSHLAMGYSGKLGLKLGMSCITLWKSRTGGEMKQRAFVTTTAEYAAQNSQNN